MVRHVIVRVWVADRPGSLGQLATTLGELGCDLIGIDVLERDGDRAIDELTVEMPMGFSPDTLVAEISSLPGVAVEDLRYLVSRVSDSERDPMEAAIAMSQCVTTDGLLETLPRVVCAAFACDWSAVLDTGSRPTSVVTVAGEPPNSQWLSGFIGGVSACGSGMHEGAPIGPRDVAWSMLDSAEYVIVVGRDGPPFRGRERRQLQQLSRIADARFTELVQRERAPAST